MIRDFRFALRLLGRDRWFATVAVVALALGIGVNATVFTLVNAVLIRGLPFPDSHELFIVEGQTRNGRIGVSYADLQDWRAASRTFAGLAGVANTSFNISDDRGAPEQARGSRLTANAFGVLGQRPLHGRDFLPGDEARGAAPVVMLGYRLWTNRYGADPSVVGRTVRLNGEPTTIVGVMPENMMFPTNAELWTAFAPTEVEERRSWRGLMAFGRIRADVSRAAAQAEMNAIAAQLAAAHPEVEPVVSATEVQTFNDRFNGGEIRVVFLALLGAVGFVLLIVCANVANLLLSRSVRRAREMAVRFALGATRWRVIRQLLAESVLLGVLGGVFGLLIAMVGVRLFDAAVADVGKPYWIDFRIDWVVAAYLAAVCVATGIIFGLAPALQVSRTNVNEVLSDGSRGSTAGRRARWFSSTMVVAELALTLVLLVGAGLMMRSFLMVSSLDLGVRTDGLMSMRVQLADARYREPASRTAFFDALGPRVAAIPGVEAVSLSTSLPLAGTGSRGFEIDGRPAVTPENRPAASAVTITPDFFDTVGVAMARGRAFTATDGAPGSEVVIVNERFAAQFFPGEDPVGRRLRFPTATDATPVWREIVGVSPSIRHNSPQDPEPAAAVYVPFRQEPPASALLVVRSRMAPSAIMNAVRTEVQAIDRDQPVFSMRTMDEMLAQARWPFTVFGSLFAILAFLALVVSAVGLYAVMAYSVTQRTAEIGLRMALGAGGAQVLWLVLRRGLVQTAVGLALGLTGAWFTSAVLASVLVQISPRDPVTFAVITAILLVVAMAACLVPAARAMRLDPLAALRKD
ncbi:MAG TPA: ABC transporter permease [Vicinamibacterales bacterium]|nr:ABC transporter permease [Vicinamibacterales bacterium]